MARISACGVLLAVLSFLPAAQAEVWTISNSSLVPLNTRGSWCQNQEASCGFLCGPGSNQTSANGCDHTALVANCVCKDGTIPDLRSYLRTLPTYICEWNYEQCQIAAPNASWDCDNDIKSHCGTREPNPALVTTSTESAATAAPTTLNIAFSPTTTASIVSSTPELGPIIGGAVSGLLAIIAAVAGLFYWLGRRSRRRRQRKDRERSNHSPRRYQSPRPPSEIEHDSKPGAVSDVQSDPAGREAGGRTSTSISEANSGNSDDLKTLVTEKRPGHQMVKDLTDSPAIEDAYFDTAKYRMPPPVKPS